MKNNNPYLNVLIVLFLLIVINLLSNSYFKRFDLTHDKRYTLSEETLNQVDRIEDDLIIKVYLQGKFPAEFKRIQLETNQFLEELRTINEQIQFRFIDPLSNSKELIEKGLQPSRLTVQEGGTVSEAMIFPWAVINYKGKEEKVSLLVDAQAVSQEHQLQQSIENLEYAFASAIHKITTEKNKKIAILKGNGQPDDIYLYSFLKNVGEYYRLAEFTLDSVETNPERALSGLNDYDLALVVKPTLSFTEKEKLALDQYIMNGGKTIWLLDQIQAETDSLMVDGKSLAVNRSLNLTDMLFSYGVRINYNVTKDLYSSTLRLAAGNTGNQIQYEDFLWPYYPLVFASNRHAISKNTDPIILKYPSSIDTLSNHIKKTVLIESSPLAKIIGTPTAIALDEIATQPDKNSYTNSQTMFGVLLEGEFTSAYQSRILPFNLSTYKNKSSANKMLIVSDGDIALNEVLRGEPMELSKDKWTQQRYGNSDFLLNSVHYLIDDSGLINLRSKSLQIQFLDKEKVYEKRSVWQLINILLPMFLLLSFGWLYNFYRKKRFG